MKKILMVIPNEGFRDEEYFEPKEVFEKEGYQITTAATEVGEAIGKYGQKTVVEMALNQVNVNEFNAILFIGGPGCFQYFEDPIAHKIAKEAIQNDKLLGAICAAPCILAHAGVLEGKKATMYTDEGTLTKFGATYTGAGVEIDGKIITATGPDTATEWANTIVNQLNSI